MASFSNPASTLKPIWDEAMARAYRLRWRIWFVAVLSHAIGLFHRAAMGPMADRIMADFELTAVAFGSLGAVYFYVYAAMQIPSGTLADTLGPRKTITAGLLCTTAGSLVMGFAPTFEILYLGRVLVSFGASTAWLSVLKVIMNWYRSREVATVTGLAGAINNTGQLLAATPLALLIIAIGWRGSFMVAAATSFAVAILTWIVVRDSPRQVGLPSIGQIERGSTDPVERPHQGLSMRLRLHHVVRNPRLWPLFLVAMGVYGSYSTFFLNWLVVYLMQTYGIAREHAATFALASALGSIIGTTALGFISDRIQSRRIPIVTSTAITTLCFLLMTFWNGAQAPLWAFWPLSFIIGFNIGAMPVTFATVRDVSAPDLRGMSAGLVNMGAFVGAAVVQPLFGYILDRGWTGEMSGGIRHYPPEAYQNAMMLVCALIALGFIGALLMKTTRSQSVEQSKPDGILLP